MPPLFTATPRPAGPYFSSLGPSSGWTPPPFYSAPDRPDGARTPDGAKLCESTRPTTALGGHVEPRSSSTPLWKIWRTELLFCLASLGCFMTIVAVLSHFDNKPLPALPLHVTLNTFLATFTTLTKAAFMFPVVEALSQWKWNIYCFTPTSRRRRRPLLDFHALDLASRGTWGSCLALGRFRWSHFAVVGAALSVLGVAVSPLTQQAISYPDRLAPVPPGPGGAAALMSRATVPALRRWTGNVDTTTAVSLRGVQDGLMAAPQQDPAGLHAPPRCATGQCAFPHYGTVGLCSRTVDVSDRLSVRRLVNASADSYDMLDTDLASVWSAMAVRAQHIGYNASLPNGLFLPTMSPFACLMQGMTADQVLGRDQFDDIAFATVIPISIIYANQAGADTVTAAGDPTANRTAEPVWNFQAVEVYYYVCARTLETAVEDGSASTREVSAAAAPAPPGAPPPPGHFSCQWSPITMCRHTALNSTDEIALRDPGGGPPAAAADFTFGVDVGLRLGADILNGLTGFGMIDPGPDKAYWSGINQPFLFRTIYGDYDRGSSPVGYRTDANFTDQLARIRNGGENIAITITSLARQLPEGVAISGTALQSETFVSIRWGWLAFLGVLLVVSWTFLVITMVVTSQLDAPPVRSSSLAVMMAPSEGIREVLGGIDDGGGFERVRDRAASVQVRFEGGRLVEAAGIEKTKARGWNGFKAHLPPPAQAG